MVEVEGGERRGEARAEAYSSGFSDTPLIMLALPAPDRETRTGAIKASPPSGFSGKQLIMLAFIEQDQRQKCGNAPSIGRFSSVEHT
jgi:hypothetical protein